MFRELTGVWLGRRRYAPTYRLQLELFEARKRGEVGDSMLCLEHAPVITLGRGAKAEHLLESREVLGARGVDVEDTDRGGEITLHAPGQLVGYPIVGLAPERCDVRRYVRDLMSTMRELIAPYGIDAGEMPGLVGLWVDAERPASWRGPADAQRSEQQRSEQQRSEQQRSEQQRSEQQRSEQQRSEQQRSEPQRSEQTGAQRPAKIGAIGVRISRWVTMHGFALNVAPELSLFRSIVPCGVTQYGVCSMQSLGAKVPEVSDLAALAWMRLAGRLGRGASNFVDASEVPDDELARWLMSASRAHRVA